MPLIFQVLRCYKCSVFQVHQTNKSNKWECKLCGEKQSVKRYYGLGTAKECRFHVQKLNGMRGELDAMKTNTDQDSDSSKNMEIVTEPLEDNYKPVKYSKWSNYVEETKTVEENINENMSLGGVEVVLEIPKKRRKQNTNDFKTNPKVPTVKHEQIHKNYIATSVIVPNPNTKINLVNTQSKIPQTGFNFENLKPEEEPMNEIKHNIKKFVPSKITKNSKWGQFTIEEPYETAQTHVISPSDNLDAPCLDSRQTSPNGLWFSSCDDTDLDNILKV